MKLAIALVTALVLPLSANAASKTIAKCAVNKIGDWDGARVNLLQTDDGGYKANLIFGTTVSGTMYHLEKHELGYVTIYEGSIKGQDDFTMRLSVYPSEGKNPYIEGSEALLTVTYPDLNAATGKGSLTTSLKDGFVCGKQIADFGG